MRVVVQIQSPFLPSLTSLQPITAAASPSLPAPSVSSENKNFPVTVFALRLFWIFFLGKVHLDSLTEFVMLAVSSLGNTRDENKGEMVDNFSMGVDDFPDFGNGNMLDGIDFDDLFVGINDGDVLPDLDMDTEILTEFSLSAGEDSDVNASVSAEKYDFSDSNKDEEGKASGSISGLNSSSSAGEEIVSKREDGVALSKSSKEVVKSKKSSLQSKNNSQGKRKVKVDWTPELHRRFVQAVEQLGVDKAVPSRILELMGIECLTRHNIASHLQKYRSHRKHLLAREAEAARWGQRRQTYGAGGVGGKKEMVSSWLVPTIGFPPMTPPLHNHHFRPLHVWGHPSVDQSSMHMWPKHLPPYFSPAPPPPWPPSSPLPTDAPPFWHPHHQRVQNGVTSGAPCFTPPMGATRFPSAPVPGIPSHPLYKVGHHGNSFTAPPHSPPHQPSFDFHPSKESVDAAIGDVLSKPWLPLPLGLKPPSLDGVMVELQRQGISKIPPSSCSA